MDTTLAPTSTSGWELLGQLAAGAQDGVAPADAPGYAAWLAALLARYLPVSSGYIELVEEEDVVAAVSWGEERPAGEPLALSAEGATIGRLALSGGAPLDPTFVAALAAQLALLLHTRRRAAEAALAAQLQQLVASNLELVGMLESRILLEAVLTKAIPLVGVSAGAIYGPEESDAQLNMLAAGDGDFNFPASLPLAGNSLPALVAATRVAQVGRLAPGATRRRGVVASTDERPALALPLLAQDSLVGVLVLITRGDEAAGRLRRLAGVFAEQATLLARNAQLFSQQQQRARELFVLYENSQEINTATQIESMLNRATENIALALAADHCSVLLIDEQSHDTLHVVAAYSEPGLAGTSNLEKPTISGAGVLLAQIGRGDPLPIDDTAVVAAHNPLAAALSAAGCRSALALPLRGKDQTVGLLVIGYARTRRPVSAAERNLAQVLAAQVATAILNRRLYLGEQQRASELELLHRIGQRLNAGLNLDETLEAILEGVRALRFSGARVMLVGARDHDLHLAAHQGLGDAHAGAALTDWLVRHQRPLRIADLLAPPAPFNEASTAGALTLDDGRPARAYLGVPLRANDELLGTLELSAARPNAFSEDDARLLSIVASQAAQAIANATRYEQADASLRTRIEQLRAVQRISSQLAITLDQKEILEYVLEQALKATGATQGLIALRAESDGSDGRVALNALGGQQAAEIYRNYLDGESDQDDAPYVVVETVGFAEPHRTALLNTALHRGATIAFQALARSEPELTDELTPAEQQALRASSARSALAAPIFYQAGVYGVLLLLAPQPQAFDHDAVEFLRALTHQAAVGIGNAQRYGELEHLSKQLQRRTDILSDVLEIGQLLRADRHLPNLLEQVGYSAMESANFRTVLFCLTDPDDPTVLRPVSAAGIPLTELERMGHSPLPAVFATHYLDSRFRLGRCYFVPAEEARQIEAGAETAVFSYIPFDDPRGPGEWQPDDRLCVPLYATEGALLGLMFVGDPQDRKRPTARTVEPLGIFADQAALAIENHRLLRDADARAEQMAALFQVGTAFTSTTDFDTLLERVYQEIVAYLGPPSFFYIATYLPDTEQLRFELSKRHSDANFESDKRLSPKGGLTAHIIDSGKALLIRDLQEAPYYRELAVRHFDDGLDVRSWLGVPLISQGRVIGVLSVQDLAPNVFTERDRQFLAALANQLAIAMERATLFRERERRINELNIINRIGQITSSTLDLEQMLRQTYTQLNAFLPVDSFFIFVYHEAQNEVRLSFEVDGEIEELDRSVRPPARGSLTEQIIRTRRHLLFDNLSEQYAPQGLTPIMFGTERQSASWLGVPLIVGDGSVVGVIAVMNYMPGLYGERDLAFMTTVANQLALGVQNARLLATAREQVEQLALLNQVAVSAGAEPDVQRVYQVIVDTMAMATGVDQARLVIYDRERGVAPAVAEHVDSGILDQIIVPITNSPSVDWLDEHKRPLIVEDAQSDPVMVLSHQTFRELDIRSIAMVPIIIDGEVIGAVGLDFVGRKGTFSTEDVALCQTIASQTSTAIARAHAFNAARSSASALSVKVAEQQTLLDAARILSSLLRPQEVLDKLMELVSRQLSVTTVALWTITADNMLVPAALDGIPTERGRTMRVPVGQGLTGKVADLGKALILDDVNVDGGSLYPSYQRDNNLISFMGVPVIYREETIGVLSVMTNYRRHFTEDERALLEGLADQAATALENARLFEERERRINELSTINAISAAVNGTLNIDDLLRKLHAGIGEVIDVRTSLIGLYDEASNTLSYPVAYDRGERVHFNTRSLPNGTSGWVIRNRQPLLLGSAEEAHAMGLDIAAGRENVDLEQSFLVVPLLFGQRVLGVINIQCYEQRSFDENDLQFLTTVANQAAAALNNARLFSETRQNAEEMTTLFEVTQNLSGTLDPDETQQLVADAALRLIGAELCAVLRLDERGQIEKQVLAERDNPRDDLQITFRLDGMTSKLLESGRPVAITDLAEIPNANPDALKLGIRSVLGIAIGTNDERLGALWMGSYEPHEWSEHQRSLISILANQASQALKSAQLYQMEQERRRLADTLRDVAQSFTSTMDLREIQTLILDQLARVVAYDSAAVLLRDEGYGHLQITEARGLSEQRLLDADFDVEEFVLLQALAEERRPVLIEDTQQDDRFRSLQHLGWKARTWIGAPLLVDNELVGILAIGAETPGAYDADAVQNTFALANQASQAIQNARFFDQISNLAADLERRVAERTAELEQATRQVSEEKERLEAVHTITLELTTQLDLNAIIRGALELISNNLGVARGSIMLRDPGNGELICRAVLYSQGDAQAANIPMSFAGGSGGLSGWVMQRQEPVNIADVLRDPRWVQEPGRADDVRSVAAVPLKTSDTALGVLVLSSPEVGYFTESQMNLLGTIAGVVASALANAQLYSYINDLAGTNAVLLEQQREETSKSAAVLQSVSEGVIVLDTDGTILLFNPAAENVLEIPAEAMHGQPLSVLEHFGEDETARKRAQSVYTGLVTGLKRVREGQRMYSTSLDLTDPNQVIAVNLAPVLGDDGQSYGDVAVLRDITREIEADHAKRQFISDVSHELRTPLTAVKGYVDVLLLSGTQTLSEDQLSYLGIIKNNTNRLRALIEDILDFTRPDSKKKLNFSQVDMSELIGEVVQSLRLEYERKGMQVQVEIPATLPPVMADQKRLTQVFQNMFSNAVKYTYEGGRIQVRASLNRANMLQVDVEDNGVGMTREQQKKLFRPFYRADNPLRDVAGGTGLGLAIAKEFVEQHGGEMWVQSEQSRGSTFSFIVPLEQSEPQVADEDTE